jgi:hypothetical protein
MKRFKIDGSKIHTFGNSGDEYMDMHDTIVDRVLTDVIDGSWFVESTFNTDSGSTVSNIRIIDKDRKRLHEIPIDTANEITTKLEGLGYQDDNNKEIPDEE